MNGLIFVRITLHGVGHDHAAYDILHAMMEVAGFERFILATDGHEYALPTGEYVSHTTESSEIVSDILINWVIQETGYPCSFVLTKSSHRSVWFSLPQA